MATVAAKTAARAWIDEHRGDLLDAHSYIWGLGEPAWREYRSAAWYVEKLRDAGFDVEEGSAGMPTAFSATWTNTASTVGHGPTVLTYAEYDAVPGNSQAPVAHEEPRPGTSRFAAGHTDPHSALGVSTLAGLLATQHVMREYGIPGTLRYTGEPAEKMQGSKVVHGLRGYYDGVDAIVSFHPFYMLPLCNTARWDTHCGAYYSKVYTFLCDEPETWQTAVNLDSPIPASHSAARAPGANAALALMYTSSRMMHDAMLPSFGGWSLSDAILSDGQATADNLPARVSRIQFSWRTGDLDMAERVLSVLDANAAHAAAMAHCAVEHTWVSRNRPGIANHVLAQALYHNLADVGAPRYGAQAVAVAQAIQQELGMAPLERPFLPETERLIAPQDAEALLRRHIPAEQRNWTSDDYVEMTHYAPTVRFYVARPALASTPGQAPYPSWAMNALGGIPDAIWPTIDVAGKTIAGTFLDLLGSPDVLAQARAEFEARRASEPPSLLPADFVAPIDLPWPA